MGTVGVKRDALCISDRQVGPVLPLGVAVPQALWVWSPTNPGAAQGYPDAIGAERLSRSVRFCLPFTLCVLVNSPAHCGWYNL